MTPQEHGRHSPSRARSKATTGVHSQTHTDNAHCDDTSYGHSYSPFSFSFEPPSLACLFSCMMHAAARGEAGLLSSFLSFVAAVLVQRGFLGRSRLCIVTCVEDFS